MTFAQGRNRLTTHFSERIPVVKRRISVFPVSLCIQPENGVYGRNMSLTVNYKVVYTLEMYLFYLHVCVCVCDFAPLSVSSIDRMTRM